MGIIGGEGAGCELQLFLEDYKTKQNQLEKVTRSMEKLVMQVSYVEKLLAIKGVGLVTIAGFLSKGGDIGRFDSPKQIQKLGASTHIQRDRTKEFRTPPGGR